MILRRAFPAVALLAAACGNEAANPSNRAAAIPAPPAALERPAEYAWGDAVAARDDRLAEHVAQALGARFGKAHEDHYVATAAGVATLREDYARRLGAGWEALPLSWSAGENGFAVANGSRALVVAWLDPQPGDRVPVTLFRFGDR